MSHEISRVLYLSRKLKDLKLSNKSSEIEIEFDDPPFFPWWVRERVKNVFNVFSTIPRDRSLILYRRELPRLRSSLLTFLERVSPILSGIGRLALRLLRIFDLISPIVNLLWGFLLAKNFYWHWDPLRRVEEQRKLIEIRLDPIGRGISKTLGRIRELRWKVETARNAIIHAVSQKASQLSASLRNYINFQALEKFRWLAYDHLPRQRRLIQNTIRAVGHSMNARLGGIERSWARELKEIRKRVDEWMRREPGLRRSIELERLARQEEQILRRMRKEHEWVRKFFFEQKSHVTRNLRSLLASRPEGTLSRFISNIPRWARLGEIIGAATGIGTILMAASGNSSLRSALDRIFNPIANIITSWATTLSATIPKPRPGVAYNPQAVFSAVLRLAILPLCVQIFMAEIIRFLTNINLRRVAAILYDVSGFNQITVPLMTTFYRASLHQPFKYWANYQYRPYLPHPVQAEEAFRRRFISADSYAHYLRCQGHPEEWIRVLFKTAFRPLDPFSFAFLAQTAYFSPSEQRFLLQDMGYKAEVFKYLNKAPLMWGLLPYKGGFRSATMDLVKIGYLSVAEAVRDIYENVRTLDYPTAIRAEAERKSLLDFLKDKLKLAEDKFKKGLSSLGELQKEAAEVIKDPKKREIFVRHCVVKKAAKVKEEQLPDNRKSIASYLINLFKEGFITAKRYLELLKKYAHETNLDVLLLARANFKKLYDDRMDELKYYKTAFHAYELTYQEFQESLKRVILDDYKRELIAKTEKIKRDRKVKKKIRDLKEDIKNIGRKLTYYEEQKELTEKELEREEKEKRIYVLQRRLLMYEQKINELNEKLRDLNTQLERYQRYL